MIVIFLWVQTLTTAHISQRPPLPCSGVFFVFLFAGYTIPVMNVRRVDDVGGSCVLCPSFLPGIWDKEPEAAGCVGVIWEGADAGAALRGPSFWRSFPSSGEGPPGWALPARGREGGSSLAHLKVKFMFWKFPDALPSASTMSHTTTRFTRGLQGPSPGFTEAVGAAGPLGPTGRSGVREPPGRPGPAAAPLGLLRGFGIYLPVDFLPTSPPFPAMRWQG